MQLKDSVLSLAAMECGKAFAGLADGTLVVFEVSLARQTIPCVLSISLEFS